MKPDFCNGEFTPKLLRATSLAELISEEIWVRIYVPLKGWFTPSLLTPKCQAHT